LSAADLAWSSTVGAFLVASENCVSFGSDTRVTEGEASLAAVNVRESAVISGAAASVEAIAEGFTARGVRTRRLVVSHAFHSARMDGMLEAFAEVARSVRYQRGELALVSNVTGALGGEEMLTGDYWVQHVRGAVRFADGVRAAHAAGVRTFIELGPRATLVGQVPGSLSAEAGEPVLLATLRAEKSEAAAALEALGGWWAQGGTVDWAGVFPAGGRRRRVRSDPVGPERELDWRLSGRRAGGGARHRAGRADAGGR
jgi:acyl transferase domain-containing protein